MSNILWFFGRIIAILTTSSGIIAYSSSKTNLDWLACFLISTFVGFSLFIWLILIRNRPKIDWTKPMSLTQPFWPMIRFPIRFWLIISISLIIGGLSNLLKHSGDYGQYLIYSITFIFMGIAILLAIIASSVIKSKY